MRGVSGDADRTKGGVVSGSDESVAALKALVDVVREELTDRAVSYTVGDRSVTFYGDGLGRLIQATLRGEKALEAMK